MSDAAHEPAGPARDEALDSFLDKWRARWPEWAVAQAFVPPQQRDIAIAWAALQQELTDAAWGGSDARPGEAKLAWWMEELQGWSRGLRRHPLGITLQKHAAPWTSLGAAIPSLRDSRERPRDRDDAFAALAPFAQAVVQIEAALFDAGAADAAIVQAGLLQARLAHTGEASVPMSVIARMGEGSTRAWAAELLDHWPHGDASRPRRVWNALARQRLRRGDASLPLPPWAALWTTWRGARG
ncbi:phytoene/squalene synthase family protein [Lysobacter auxotrophicus]|uniref:Phytoene/squalene synthase family protein n=1 Tax=Lysobacter auxotrophicus TaxID=2992573 RepID=A0ABM8DF46_9GAMM|nr:phytoene/squalene synthase family protein [Lysobacter auxotrophicus]BDU17169.1 phytoene/squalene synthase family protein [Lysobacter auxotrophicus]